MLCYVLLGLFAVLAMVTAGLETFVLAEYEFKFKNFARWAVTITSLIGGFQAFYHLGNGNRAEVPAFSVLAPVITCIGYFVYCWVIFFVDQKKEKAQRLK